VFDGLTRWISQALCCAGLAAPLEPKMKIIVWQLLAPSKGIRFHDGAASHPRRGGLAIAILRAANVRGPELNAVVQFPRLHQRFSHAGAAAEACPKYYLRIARRMHRSEPSGTWAIFGVTEAFNNEGVGLSPQIVTNWQGRPFVRQTVQVEGKRSLRDQWLGPEV